MYSGMGEVESGLLKKVNIDNACEESDMEESRFEEVTEIKEEE